MDKTTTAAETYAGGLTRRQVVAWRNAMFVIFALCGVGMASWVARVPAVRDSFGASIQEMGVLIFGIALGSILGLLASSHLIARLGARRTMSIFFIVGPAGFVVAGLGASFGPSFLIVFLGLTVFGAGLSICDVAMNVSGAANERVLRRTIMPIYHAFFSFGTMAGAGLGALAEYLQLPIWVHITIIGVLIFGVAQIALRSLHSEHLVDGGEAVVDAEHDTTWRDRLSIWRDPRTLFIGLIVLGMAFAEGSANDWLALAMVDGHGVENATGAVMFGISRFFTVTVISFSVTGV
jgi:MFS family permease